MITRAEHLAWCKQRALAELEHGGPQNGLASMLSDLSKHPETADHAAIQLTAMLMLGGFLSTHDEVRRHIEGFN